MDNGAILRVVMAPVGREGRRQVAALRIAEKAGVGSPPGAFSHYIFVIEFRRRRVQPVGVVRFLGVVMRAGASLHFGRRPKMVVVFAKRSRFDGPDGPGANNITYTGLAEALRDWTTSKLSRVATRV
jgi:hypothetical protein